MAQKKIDIYANFQPTSIDNTGAQSMAALAGLAESVGDVAFQIGKQKRTEQGIADGVEAAEAALLEAAQDQPVNLPQESNFTIYGRQKNETANAAFLAGIQQTGQTIINETAIQNPSDVNAFLALTDQSISGITDNLSPELKFEVQNYFKGLQRNKAKTIATDTADAAFEVNKSEVDSGVNELGVNALNAAYNQDSDLLLSTLQQMELLTAPLIANNPAYASSALKQMQQLKIDLVVQSNVGKVNREILENDSLLPEQRIDQVNGFIADLKSRKAVTMDDPLNEGESITLDPDQREQMIAEIEGDRNNYAASISRDKAKKVAEAATQQALNYQIALDIGQDTSKTESQRIEDLNRMAMLGKITTGQKSLVVNWINSVKKNEAVTSDNVIGEFIERIYDINALLDADVDTPNSDYLDGVAAIKADILKESAAGRLSPKDVKSLNGTMANLVSAKQATATAQLDEDDFTSTIAFQSFQKKLNVIRVDYRNAVTREFYYRSRDLEQEFIAANDIDDRKEKKAEKERIENEFDDLANQVIQEQQNDQFLQSQQIINRVLQKSVTKDPSSFRSDGSVKSAKGYLGPIENLVQGGTMTEVSIDTEVDGYGEIQIPTMVPTLTNNEINILANMQLEGNAKNIPKSIINKAKKHAKQRLDNGLNPFYQDNANDLINKAIIESQNDLNDDRLGGR